jgi:hypothetical protein
MIGFLLIVVMRLRGVLPGGKKNERKRDEARVGFKEGLLDGSDLWFTILRI